VATADRRRVQRHWGWSFAIRCVVSLRSPSLRSQPARQSRSPPTKVVPCAMVSGSIRESSSALHCILRVSANCCRGSGCTRCEARYRAPVTPRGRAPRRGAVGRVCWSWIAAPQSDAVRQRHAESTGSTAVGIACPCEGVKGRVRLHGARSRSVHGRKTVTDHAVVVAPSNECTVS
jgi:hypothetical protein